MAPPLPSPLIPLPKGAESEFHDRDDLFATLFSPPTPRASPVPGTLESRTVRPPIAQNHSRASSTDSEFGSFVSVPSNEDPLHTSHSAAEISPFSPIQNIDFFDRIIDGAKAATEKSKRGLLDELLHHQDDPLYFLQSSHSATTSRTATPIPSSVTSAQPAVENLQSAQDQPLVDFSPDASVAEVRQSRHLTRQRSRSELSVGDTRSRSPLRSPSLPPSSPTRISTPEVQRTQSFFTPTSLSSRWVSSILSSAVRPAGRGKHTAESKQEDEGASHSDPVHSSATPATLPSQLFGSLSSLARPIATAPSSQTASAVHPADVDASITHGSPFASQPFIPATGAPGFAGDRQWDKGFEFDRADVEKKSVRLVGRREVTIPVLTVELADMIRPHFSALPRLPRSWSLLYSLDQHGISLNTLYARCQAHTGGALLVMRDSGNTIFGAWMGEGIHHSKGSYYGSGESFLWRLAPDNHLQVYKWTGKNNYVALCEQEYVSFGGGDGHYGLYLDESLTDGSSARCPTFNNDPLCSAGPRQGENIRFECVGLEVWGVG